MVATWLRIKYFFDAFAELHLASARRTKAEDTTDEDIPSTSGRQYVEATASDSSQSTNLKVVLASIVVL